MKVVFSPAAKADLLEIALYIAQDNRLVHRRLAYWRIVQKNAAAAAGERVSEIVFIDGISKPSACEL